MIFYRNGDNIPFFNKNGDIEYPNIDIKLKQAHLEKIPKGDVFDDLITEIKLDEELFIKLLPSLDLYQVVSVQIERHRIRKI